MLKRLIQAAAILAVAAGSVAADRYLLPVFGVDGPQKVRDPEVPVDYEGTYYHGHDEHFQPVEKSGKRWPKDKITWSVDYQSARGLNPPLSEDAIRSAIKTATGWWTDSLALEVVEVAYPSGDVPVVFKPLDGPSGTLAQAYLADGTNRPKPMEIDSAERWTAGPPAPNLVSLPTVFCHEFGHSLGLGHDDSNSPAVMAPIYTARIPREQPRDVDRMVSVLGYTRRPAVPGGKGGSAVVLNFNVQAKASDLADALKTAGWEVKEPK